MAVTVDGIETCGMPVPSGGGGALTVATLASGPARARDRLGRVTYSGNNCRWLATPGFPAGGVYRHIEIPRVIGGTTAAAAEGGRTSTMTMPHQSEVAVHVNVTALPVAGAVPPAL